MSATGTLQIPHAPVRRRHEVRLRQLTLSRMVDLTPTMRRLTFSGEAMEGFVSLGFDDHVKMFFPAPGESEPRLPIVGPDAGVFPRFPRTVKPIGRPWRQPTVRHRQS